MAGWEELSEYAGLEEIDFWEDADALSPMDYLNGQTAWKVSYHDCQNTDNDKFAILALEAKKLYEEMKACEEIPLTD